MTDQPAENLSEPKSPFASEEETPSSPQTVELHQELASLTPPPPKTKIRKPLLVTGALVILLMAATLPAAIYLVSVQTRIAPQAQQIQEEPQIQVGRPSGIERINRPLTAEAQQADWVRPFKPQNVEVTATTSGTTKITFTTQGVYSSSIVYTPQEDWDYLTMVLEEDWSELWINYQSDEEEKKAFPLTGTTPQTDHEYLLENLVPGQKYYYVIQIYNPEKNEAYEFGLEQPEYYYTFIAQ